MNPNRTKYRSAVSVSRAPGAPLLSVCPVAAAMSAAPTPQSRRAGETAADRSEERCVVGGAVLLEGNGSDHDAGQVSHQDQRYLSPVRPPAAQHRTPGMDCAAGRLSPGAGLAAACDRGESGARRGPLQLSAAVGATSRATSGVIMARSSFSGDQQQAAVVAGWPDSVDSDAAVSLEAVPQQTSPAGACPASTRVFGLTPKVSLSASTV